VLFDQSLRSNERSRQRAWPGTRFDMFFTEDDGPPKFSQTMNERFIAEMGCAPFQLRVVVHYRECGTRLGTVVAVG